MSAIGDVTSGVEKYRQDNSMDINTRYQSTKEKSEGASSTDFDDLDAVTKDREIGRAHV